jgi:hypothetical protein
MASAPRASASVAEAPELCIEPKASPPSHSHPTSVAKRSAMARAVAFCVRLEPTLDEEDEPSAPGLGAGMARIAHPADVSGDPFGKPLEKRNHRRGERVDVERKGQDNDVGGSYRGQRLVGFRRRTHCGVDMDLVRLEPALLQGVEEAAAEAPGGAAIESSRTAYEQQSLSCGHCVTALTSPRAIDSTSSGLLSATTAAAVRGLLQLSALCSTSVLKIDSA